MACGAECIAVPCIISTCQCCSSFICQCCCCAPVKEEGEERIRSCINLKKNLASLHQQIEALKVYTDPNKEADLWRERLSTLIENETQLNVEYDKLKLERYVCKCIPNICGLVQLGNKVNRKLQDASKLTGQAEGFNNSSLQRSPSTVESRRHEEPVGMGPLLSRLCVHFNDETSNIIGIHGPPGVGKTMLLSVFNNKLEERDDYDVVIFIEVSNSQVLYVTDMQRSMYRRLKLTWDDAESESIRAQSLLGFLTKKKFVIILDNVHNTFKIEDVGIPDPSGADIQGKLILASQSENVCANMEVHTNNMIKVECLKPTPESDPAWDLFKRNLSNEANEAIERDSVIMKKAKVIVSRCNGLPLAIKAVGRAVASLENQTDRSSWTKAAKRMKKNPSLLPDNFFDRLKYCYDQLKTENQRSYFLYCALFPENASIKKKKIINYCAPEDHTLEYNDWDEIIGDLASASLLERSGDSSEVKMHSIFRKLALWLASAKCKNVSSEFLVQAGFGSKVFQAPIPSKWERATRISLMFNDIKKLDISPRCTGLSTLLLQNNPNLKELCHDFFKNMPGLKVLDLSHTAIDKLPIAAGTLRRLQHLNLCDTRIAKLSEELSNLKELRHLDLSETPILDEIPDGTISVLYNLRVLNLYRSLFEIRGRGDLNLEQLVNLEFLGITVHSEEVLEKLKTDDRLARSTRYLSIQSCEGMKSVQVSVFQHMKRLKVLFVRACRELKHLSLHDMQNGLNLRELTLASLPNFEGIILEGPQSSHHLDKLRDLIIESCHQLKNVTWILQLKSLERLVISQCDAMEHVVQEAGNGDASQANETRQEEQEGEIQEVLDQGQNGGVAIPTTESSFRCLKSIILKDLKNLESICHRSHFPRLKIPLKPDNCPILKTGWWSESH